MSPARKAKPTPERIIRDPEFGRRLNSACDAHPQCPPLHKGRLTWVQQELRTRFKEEVSVETVRKWMSGEAKPRPEKVSMLAEILQVDMSWLSLGVDKGLAPREMKARSREIEGAVNAVAGFIEMDGSHAAFASEADQKRGVDLHAIIKGAKYDLHVAVYEDGMFRVPPKRDGVVVLGCVKNGFSLSVYELSDAVIEKNGTNRGGMVEVKVQPSRLSKVESFAQRL